jgi:beta-glucosidase
MHVFCFAYIRSYDNGLDPAQAATVAAAADIAIVVVADDSVEGFDRPNLHFTGNQDDLVFAVAASQPNTIVICINPSAVLTPWADQVSAVLAMLMPGQEEGNAAADIIFGDVEPSGRLPITLPNKVGSMIVTSPWLSSTFSAITLPCSRCIVRCVVLCRGVH